MAREAGGRARRIVAVALTDVQYYWPCVNVVALEVVEREDRVGDDHYSDEIVEEGEWQEHVREGGHADAPLMNSSLHQYSHQSAQRMRDEPRCLHA